MFRRRKLPRFDADAQLIQRLNKVMEEYQKLAYSDPGVLRLLIPADEVWRFFIDGVVQKQETWLDFEDREAGYLKALYNSFQEIFDNSLELDVNLIRRLHKLATGNVSGTNYADYNETNEIGDFRDDYKYTGGYYLSASGRFVNVTVEGLVELFNAYHSQISLTLQFYNKSCPTTTFEDFILDSKCVRAIRKYIVANNNQNANYDADEMIFHLQEYFCHDIRYQVPHLSSEIKSRLADIIINIGLTRNDKELAEAVIKIIRNKRYDDFRILVVSMQPQPVQNVLAAEIAERVKTFKRLISVANTPLEKLSTIVYFIQSCEQLHAFSDGNCRTFCMLIFSFLLIRHGLPLAILNDPNRFDAFSHRQLLLEAVAGMENTFKLIKEGKLFDVTTEDARQAAEDDELDYFEECVDIEEIGRKRPIKRRNYN